VDAYAFKFILKYNYSNLKFKYQNKIVVFFFVTIKKNLFA